MNKARGLPSPHAERGFLDARINLGVAKVSLLQELMLGLAVDELFWWFGGARTWEGELRGADGVFFEGEDEVERSFLGGIKE